MDRPPAAPRKTYTLKHTTRPVRAMVTELRYRLDVHTLERDDGRAADALALNEIGRVSSAADRARCSSTTTAATGVTGSFVLIDEATNQTVAAGMIRLDGGADRTPR